MFQGPGKMSENGRITYVRVPKVRKKRRSSHFWKAFWIYASALAVIFGIVLVLLWKKLSDYQKDYDDRIAKEAQEVTLDPARLAQEYFTDYIAGLGAKDLAELWFNSHPEHYDSEENVENVMREVFLDEPFSEFRSSEYTQSNPTYVIRRGTEELAKVRLKEENGKWAVDSFDFAMKGNEVTVTVPSDAMVSVGGSIIDRNRIVQTDECDEPSEYTEDLGNAVSYDTYCVSGILAEPDFSVDGGRDYPIITDTNGIYCYAPGEEDSELYKDKALEFVKSLIHYSSALGDVDAGMSAALAHVASPSEAARVIRAAYDGLIWNGMRPNVSFEYQVGDAYVIADNCYAVDVSYNKTSDSDNGFYGDGTYRVYFLDKGNGFKIYQFEMK